MSYTPSEFKPLQVAGLAHYQLQFKSKLKQEVCIKLSLVFKCDELKIEKDFASIFGGKKKF